MPKISIEAWDLLRAVEQFWHENRFFPSNSELEKITNLSKEFIETTLDDDDFRRRIENRGIDMFSSPNIKKGEVEKNSTQLSDKQLAVAMAILNVADTRPLGLKLKTLGVSQTTYQGWMKNRAFVQFIETQMDTLFGSAMPLVHKALIDKAVSGDVKAIKFIYEKTGVYTGQQSQELRNFELLIFQIIEIIQKYISDPNTQSAIASDMKALLGQGTGPNAQHLKIKPELTSGL